MIKTTRLSDAFVLACGGTLIPATRVGALWVPGAGTPPGIRLSGLRNRSRPEHKQIGRRRATQRRGCVHRESRERSCATPGRERLARDLTRAAANRPRFKTQAWKQLAQRRQTPRRRENRARRQGAPAVQALQIIARCLSHQQTNVQGGYARRAQRRTESRETSRVDLGS